MHAVLVLFRPLPNVGTQNFGMWGMYNLAKAYRSIKNPLPIAESRTGKPAMVTLKIQPDSSTVHDTFLWANIYVRSHLRCGTDSVSSVFLQVSQIFQRRKSDANKQDFENKFNLTCHAQSTPKTTGILTKVLSTSGQGQSPPPPKKKNKQNNRDLNQGLLHLWPKFGAPSWNGSWVIARTSSWLTHARTHTHTQTDAGNDNTRRPILASGKKWELYKGKHNEIH